MEKIILEKLPWLQKFTIAGSDQLMRKSALKQGDTLAAYTTEGELVWLDKSILIIPVKDENTDKLLKVLHEDTIAAAFTTVQECDATKAR